MIQPRIAIVPGDPAGIGPELVAKLLEADGVLNAANILLIGDSHLFERGGQQAGLEVPLNTLTEVDIVSQEGLSHLEMDTIFSK